MLIDKEDEQKAVEERTVEGELGLLITYWVDGMISERVCVSDLLTMFRQSWKL